MIVVRNVFVAKPGHASKLAVQLKQAAGTGKLPKHRILTDMTGEFNRVVLEYEVADLDGVGAVMHQYATDEALKAAMKGYTDLWVSGTRELFQVA